MAIKIKHEEGIIKIVGELTSENATTLKQHFDNFTKELDDIILSLDHVTHIEPGGAFTMEQLYLDFIKSNRVIQVIGRENKNIAKTMKNTKTSYILSNDRV
ncbi:MAG: STAS domain-containing protein [Maribacter sp.]